MPTLCINNKHKSGLIFNFFLFLIIFSLLYISYVYTGFRFHFALMDVYDLRLEARGYTPPLMLSYLLSAADYVMIFILIHFLSKKRYVISVLIFILNLLNFGISGSKHIVFLLFLSLLVYFFIKTKDVKKYILPFIICILILSIIENYFFETVFLTLFLSYRVLIIPSKLHYIYYEYFSNHEFDYFRQSFLKFFIDSPYKDNIGFIIGEYDTNDIGGRANNGLFSDAYFNLGLIGILLFPLILASLLKLFDGAVKNLDARMYFSIALSIFLALLSLPLTTAILSSGLLIFLILLYFVPFEKQ
jgi:oligosaccharide repeat unit polymerase